MCVGLEMWYFSCFLKLCWNITLSINSHKRARPTDPTRVILKWKTLPSNLRCIDVVFTLLKKKAKRFFGILEKEGVGEEEEEELKAAQRSHNGMWRLRCLYKLNITWKFSILSFLKKNKSLFGILYLYIMSINCSKWIYPTHLNNNCLKNCALFSQTSVSAALASRLPPFGSCALLTPADSRGLNQAIFEGSSDSDFRSSEEVEAIIVLAYRSILISLCLLVLGLNSDFFFFI